MPGVLPLWRIGVDFLPGQTIGIKEEMLNGSVFILRAGNIMFRDKAIDRILATRTWITIVATSAAIMSIVVATNSASPANAASGWLITQQSLSQQQGVEQSTTDTLSMTVYLPVVTRLYPNPLFVGLYVRWDGAGYGHGSQVWDVGSHVERTLDVLTDADTIRSSNRAWYDPNPFNWPIETWFSYYSVSTLEFKASSAPGDPSWKWTYYWILPYRLQLSNGATVMIDTQPFIASGPFAGYTAFGQAVEYWQLVNRDTFLFWDGGGDWKQYVHAGEITLRYDAGKTRLLLHRNVLRRWYYRSSLTSDTIQYIDNLTETNAFSASQSWQQDADQTSDATFVGDAEQQQPLFYDRRQPTSGMK